MRQLTEEMRDLVFGTTVSALVEGAVDVGIEEPKHKARRKVQTTAAPALATRAEAVRRKKRDSGSQ
jgi:hypothetical protein